MTISDVHTNSFKVKVGTAVRQEYTPTASTYNPATGDLSLTIGAHPLLAATSHTATDATYTPADGKVVIEVAGHGFKNGDLIQVVDGGLTFTCTHGGGNHSYPRTTDPISGKFVEIFDVTTDTFTIQCLETIPSTNTTTHTFVSALADGIKKAQDTITIDENGLVFTCEMDKRATEHSYPRKSDPAYNSALAISAVTSDGITVNVGKSPLVNYTPTNAIYNPSTGVMELVIGAHNLSAGQSIKLADGAVTFSCDKNNHQTVTSYPRTDTKGFEVTAVDYNPNNGVLIVTSPAHGFVNDDWIKIKKESLIMTCALDGNTAKKKYPRSTDYAHDRWLKVSNVTTDTFEVVVLDKIPSNNTDPHTFVSLPKLSPHFADYNPTTGMMTVQNERFNVSNAEYTPATGDMKLYIGTHDMEVNDKIRLVANSLSFSCEYNGATSTHTYPRSNGSDPTYNVDITIRGVGSNWININVNPTYGTAISHAVPHTFQGATVGCVQRNHGLNDGDHIRIDDEAFSFSCTQGLGTHKYPRASKATFTAAIPSNTYDVTTSQFNPSTGHVELTCQAHAFTAPTTHQATAGTYLPATGIMTLTITGHGWDDGDLIKIDDNALSFSCTHGGGGTSTYPRSTDPISGKWIQIFNVTTNTFDIQVLDKIPSTNTTVHTFVSCTATGISYATSVARIAPNSLRYTCVMDGNTATKTYPRAKDPYFGKDMAVTGVTGTTVTIFVGKTPIVNYSPTDGTYDPATGSLTLEIGAHSISVGDTIKLANQGLTFQCAKDNYATDHQYPRANGQGGATGDDPAYDTALTITAVSDTSITLNVGVSPDTSIHRWKPGFTGTNAVITGGDYAHTWPVGFTATDALMKGGSHYYPESGILKIETTANHGMNNGDWIKFNDNAITLECTQGAGQHLSLIHI